MTKRSVAVASRATAIAVLAGALVGIATPARAETCLVDDRASFVAAMPHLTLEDFETATLEGIVEGCGSLVSRETPTGCFDANGLQPGIAYLTSRHPDPENQGIGAMPRSNHGELSQQILGAGDIIVGFNRPVDTVGLDLGVEYFATTCLVTVFYVDGGTPREFPIECRESPSAPGFVGITSDRLIRGILIDPAGREASPFIDNVRFGLRAPNDFAITAVRTHRASGSATVVAKVPCAGVTAVKGRGVVAARVASRTNETVQVKVSPTAATKRKLNRTGEATVTLAVTFSPTGGIPATTTRRVTLRKD